ncbi:DUF4198 domain-containing protein [Sphingomonas sp. KR1UV-12]|uniref:DUF4198 domain-containing protein n=1 Tax=Sphingomonas aurea TaxID=3063994 RepID=A0ABT9EMH3_9SPHN|nr:DUF4198 domain-containing protein [Sphingomonas sp. KR1UV-12]MDP1028152.1 DUF4198 domain-containing protein [Sphingomonas sp. KR1UV-12]
MTKPFLTALLLVLPVAAQAHEVWIERDGNGPARIYLGEPAEVPPPGGDPEFAKLKAPIILGRSGKAPARPVLIRRAGYLEAAVPVGDVHAWDDRVFAPWGPAGKQETVVYYARAGRTTAATRLPFEIAPEAPDASRFVLRRDGRPVPNAAVTLVTPARREVKLTTDDRGAFDVPTPDKGRYLLTAARQDGPATIAGNPVAVVHRITTTTFVAP